MSEDRKDTKVRVVSLDTFVEGEDHFTSRGVTHIKVRCGEETLAYVVPIKSTGISELTEALNRQAPVPPKAKLKVEPGTDMARDLGIVEKQWVFLPDYTDKEYLEAVRRFRSESTTKIILKGLDVKFIGKDGSLVEDDDYKARILESLKLSPDQMAQLTDDIMALTKWSEEERRSFLYQQ